MRTISKREKSRLRTHISFRQWNSSASAVTAGERKRKFGARLYVSVRQSAKQMTDHLTIVQRRRRRRRRYLPSAFGTSLVQYSFIRWPLVRCQPPTLTTEAGSPHGDAPLNRSINSDSSSNGQFREIYFAWLCSRRATFTSSGLQQRRCHEEQRREKNKISHTD